MSPSLFRMKRKFACAQTLDRRAAFLPLEVSEPNLRLCRVSLGSRNPLGALRSGDLVLPLGARLDHSVQLGLEPVDFGVQLRKRHAAAAGDNNVATQIVINFTRVVRLLAQLFDFEFSLVEQT